MSLFFPYSPTSLIEGLSTLFSLDLSSLNSYEKMILTILSNLYFFVIWFIVIFFALKLFNRVWERFF